MLDKHKQQKHKTSVWDDSENWDSSENIKFLHTVSILSQRTLPKSKQSQQWSLVSAEPDTGFLRCRLFSTSLFLTFSTLTNTSCMVQSLWDISEAEEKRFLRVCNYVVIVWSPGSRHHKPWQSPCIADYPGKSKTHTS